MLFEIKYTEKTKYKNNDDNSKPNQMLKKNAFVKPRLSKTSMY